MSANDTQVGGNHYKGKQFQPWDWDKYGIGTYEMDILHYVTRQKNGKEDLEKAVHYCQKLHEEYHKHERRNRVPFIYRPMLRQPMQDYCDEWSMSNLQRKIIAMVLFWQCDANLMTLELLLTQYIEQLYGNANSAVRSSGGVEGPESH